MDYQVNDPELQRKLDLADNVIQPKTRQESRLQRYWQSVGWKHADKKPGTTTIPGCGQLRLSVYRLRNSRPILRWTFSSLRLASRCA